MPTKKSSKKRSSKEQTGSNGDAKKRSSKRLSRKPQLQIPPVVVGGGSVLVWILKGLNLTQLGTPPNVTYLNPQMYNCYQVGAAGDALMSVVVNRGQGIGSGPNPPPFSLGSHSSTKFN
jgi:hypothetical protein